MLASFCVILSEQNQFTMAQNYFLDLTFYNPMKIFKFSLRKCSKNVK